jgi:hypothetical protein
MGSVVSLPTAVSLTLIAGGIMYGFLEKRPPPPAWNVLSLDTETVQAMETKKGKKKKAAQPAKRESQSSTTEPKPNVTPFPAIVPGGFDPESDAVAVETTMKSKGKKKKGKKTNSIPGLTRSTPEDVQSESSATAPESSTPISRPVKRKSPPVGEADGPWTRVESRKRRDPKATTSDIGITTSVTGTSSPLAGPTEDERPADADMNRRTLAEKLLPKARKTGVEE